GRCHARGALPSGRARSRTGATADRSGRGGTGLDAARGLCRGPHAGRSVRAPRAPDGPRRESVAAMRSFVALFRKELRSYFGSPLVYLVAAAFLAYTGYYFHSDLLYFVTFGFGVNIMENFWQLLFIDIRLVLILAVPLLTMRLLAEERRLGTLELLLTYPLRDGAIVAAKLGACLVVIALLLAGTLAYPVWLYRIQPFALSPLVAGYVGLLLFAGTCASYGLFISSLTDSQVLAGFLTALPLLRLCLLP